jgi:hypothetical protein
MSRQVAPFNRLEVTSGVLSRIQAGKDELIINRLVDSILQPGIAIPAGSNARDVEKAFDATATVPQFTIVAAGADKVTVGPGVAYDVNGNRIELVSGDATVFNPNAPLFTATITGVSAIQPAAGPIPYSTGRVTAFDRGAGPPYTTPDATDGARFVFVRYREVVLTKATPSNHAAATQIAITIAIATGDPDTKKPLTELDEKEGLIYAPHRVDGYEVVIVKLAGLTVPSQSVPNTPILAADTTAVYVGRYTITGGVAGTVVLNDTDRPRRLLRLRPRETGVVQSDPAKRPASYDLDQAKTLEEHVSALGTGVVSPANPHGLAIGDITGGGSEPENILYQSEVMKNGIVDLLLARNNPIPVPEVLDLEIVNTTLGTFEAYVKCRQFTVGQHVMYILGERFANLIPTLTSLGGVGTDAAVGFDSVADPSGTYVLLAKKSAANIATVAKKPIATALVAGELRLGTVYWSGTVLRKTIGRDSASAVPTVDAVETPPRPIDDRSFGLVSLPQISTEGLAHPDNGFFAKQVFQNFLINPDFFLTDRMVYNVGSNAGKDKIFGWNKVNVSGNFTPSPDPANYIIPYQAFAGSTSLLGPSAVTVSDMFTDGPKTVTGVKCSFASSTGLPTTGILHTKLRGDIRHLRSLQTYTITAWFKATAPGVIGSPAPNCTMSVLGRFVNSNGTTNLSVMADFKIDYSVNSWQRATITLVTNANVKSLGDPTAVDKWQNFEFNFISQSVTGASPLFDAADIYIANVSVVEGPWAIEVPPRYAYTMLESSLNLNNMPISANNAIGLTQYHLTEKPFISKGQFFSFRGNLSIFSDYGTTHWWYSQIKLNKNAVVANPATAIVVGSSQVSRLGFGSDMSSQGPGGSLYLEPGVHTVSLCILNQVTAKVEFQGALPTITVQAS